MFKGLAKIGARPRHMVPQAAHAHFNDNRPERRLAAALKHARPQLTCHWGAAAAGGGLECHWQIEPVDETAAETPGPRCTTRRLHGLLGTALRGKPGRTAVRRGSADGRTT
jgi:hypothetical protein